MQSETVVTALGALAQEHRLAVFRLLVEAGPQGMPAGAIADALEVAPSSMSFHLSQLHHAGLVAQRRESRSIIYSANYEAMNGLIGYLTENCCANSACDATTESGCVPSFQPASSSQRKVS